MHSLPTVGVFGQYAACRFEALSFFGLRCGIAVLLFLFCMRLFYLRLCAFCVVTVGFVSLYVSEFLIAACGVSPLRGRLKDSALKNPAALERLANFFFWLRVCWCCALEYQKQCTPQTKTQSYYCCCVSACTASFPSVESFRRPL